MYVPGMAGGVGASTLARSFSLPALIRFQRIKSAYLLIWLPYIAAYQLLNRFPLVEPRELPMTRLDAVLPFVPALLPLYLLYLPLYWWTASSMPNDREVNRFFYATHLQLALSAVFFVLIPVRMPRELFYAGAVHGWADAFWRWFDGPNNCFPSLHVSNCLTMIHFTWQLRYRWPRTFLLMAVIASTLLVKQHYVVDVLGGAAVYLAYIWCLSQCDIRGVDAYGWCTNRNENAARCSNAG